MSELTPVEREQMYALAKAMLEKSYSPYSHFRVGACLKTPAGNYYVGCNIENASYSLVQCAEACAIANMIVAGEKRINSIVVVSSGPMKCAPCGACRQRLREFGDESLTVYMFDGNHNFEMKTLEDLLPHSFGPMHMEIIL